MFSGLENMLDQSRETCPLKHRENKTGRGKISLRTKEDRPGAPAKGSRGLEDFLRQDSAGIAAQRG